MPDLKPWTGRTTVYYKPQKPTPPAKRHTFLQVAQLTGQAGFYEESVEEHAEMVATMRAESAFDVFACLCYLLIPGSPGHPSRWEADAKRYSVSGRPLPIPNYLLPWEEDDAVVFQRQIYWRNVEWVRHGIPADGALAPGYPDIKGMLEARAQGQPAHKNIRFEHVETLDQDRIDFSLAQLNAQYIRITFDPAKVCRTAFEMWQRRGFGPWVANSKGLHLPFMADARAAVRKARA